MTSCGCTCSPLQACAGQLFTAAPASCFAAAGAPVRLGLGQHWQGHRLLQRQPQRGLEDCHGALPLLRPCAIRGQVVVQD